MTQLVYEFNNSISTAENWITVIMWVFLSPHCNPVKPEFLALVDVITNVLAHLEPVIDLEQNPYPNKISYFVVIFSFGNIYLLQD